MVEWKYRRRSEIWVFSWSMGQMEIMGLELAAECILPGSDSVKLSPEKSCFFSQAASVGIHAAVNLEARMHEAEDMRKEILLLYAFIWG